MNNKQFIIELLRYGAWPLVAGAGLFFLKDKLGSMFGGGVKSAKHGDTEIQFFESGQATRPVAEDQQKLQHLIPVDPTGIREELEEKITQQLTGVTGDEEKIDILVKNLAQQQITNAFEKAYHSIYGSQIKLLEFLSTQPNGTAPVQIIVQFFDSAKENNQELYETWQFSDYMVFLLSSGLLKNENDEWSITKHGRAFITYITAMQLNKNKSF